MQLSGLYTRSHKRYPSFPPGLIRSGSVRAQSGVTPPWISRMPREARHVEKHCPGLGFHPAGGMSGAEKAVPQTSSPGNPPRLPKRARTRRGRVSLRSRHSTPKQYFMVEAGTQYEVCTRLQ